MLRNLERIRNRRSDKGRAHARIAGHVHVLVCCEIHLLNPNGMSKKRYICDGYYAAEHSIAEGCCDSDFYDAYDYDEEEDEYYLKEGWYEVIKNWDEYSSIVIEDFVTYWMPLPELPKEDDDGTD